MNRNVSYDSDFVKTFADFGSFKNWSNGRHDPDDLKEMWDNTHPEIAAVEQPAIVVPEPIIAPPAKEELDGE